MTEGFDSIEFHKRCDEIANTLTIIKSEHGNIFGGFAEKAWDSSNQLYEDPKAFIFSLVNKENKPFKAMSTYRARAIRCDPSYGPSFGGHDIKIWSNSNSNQESCSYFGYSFGHADYQFNSDKAKSILAGSQRFQTLEVEVFSVTG